MLLKNNVVFIKRNPEMGNPLDKLMKVDLSHSTTKSALFNALEHSSLNESNLRTAIIKGMKTSRVWVLKKTLSHQGRGETDSIIAGTKITFAER